MSTPAWYSVRPNLRTLIIERGSDSKTGQQDAPDYLPGIIAVMAINIAAVIIAALTMIVLRLQNKRADEGKFVCEGREGFRYTL